MLDRTEPHWRFIYAGRPRIYRRDAECAEETMRHDLGGELRRAVIGAAIEPPLRTRPRLPETTYEECLVGELKQRSITCGRQIQVLRLTMNPNRPSFRFITDSVIESMLIVETKSVDRLAPLHDAQVLTHLRLAGHQLVSQIKFQYVLLREGVRRLALSSAPSASLR